MKIIRLNQLQSIFASDTHFEHATDGREADFNTSFTLAYDSQFLRVFFHCDHNYHTEDNHFSVHNEPLYKQEVFEIFISPGEDDPKEYLEIEINPNNALWIGKILNPSLGDDLQEIHSMYHPKEAGIGHHVMVRPNSWSGALDIPWDFIGRSDRYRLNFYRIRSREAHTHENWECSTDDCDFVCWESTLSGVEPAFHRPKHFGLLQLKI